MTYFVLSQEVRDLSRAVRFSNEQILRSNKFQEALIDKLDRISERLQALNDLYSNMYT